MNEKTAILRLEAVRKSYPDFPALLRDISFDLAKGEIVGLLGDSGCGKTTLLRLIAGLEELDHGRILFDGVDLASTPTYKRNFGFMFQGFALFPHLDVGRNISFGLDVRHWSKSEKVKRVQTLLELVGLSAYEKKSIKELSGGQKQRVALARCLAPHPRLLLLDEPMSSLDQTLKNKLAAELKRIINVTRIPALYVTHDLQEAQSVASRILRLEESTVRPSSRL